jgi:hypothetical protein
MQPLDARHAWSLVLAQTRLVLVLLLLLLAWWWLPSVVAGVNMLL